jgi:hypothetical protein
MDLRLSEANSASPCAFSAALRGQKSGVIEIFWTSCRLFVFKEQRQINVKSGNDAFLRFQANSETGGPRFFKADAVDPVHQIYAIRRTAKLKYHSFLTQFVRGTDPGNAAMPKFQQGPVQSARVVRGIFVEKIDISGDARITMKMTASPPTTR